MRMTPRSFLASAAALLLGWALLLPARALGEDSKQSQAAAPESASPAEPARSQDGGDRPQGAEAKGASSKGAQDRSAGEGARTRGKGKGKRPRTGRPLEPGSTLPPTNLKKIGDHWTPYDPPDPESFPPEATLHIIVPGDCLWDLADLAFGNPYLWPQIWNENRYILDSHWIYPGDPLLMPARPTVVGEVVPQGQEGAPPAPPVEGPKAPEQAEEPLTAEAPEAEAEAPEAHETRPIERPRAPEEAHAPRTVPKLTPLADETDIRCGGFIAKRDEEPDYFIANQEDEAKMGLTEGDIIYINRGKENGHVEPGTEYSIVVRDGEVRHPITHSRVGVYYKRLGSVKILAGQERTAIAIISLACDEIRTGYDLVPLKVTKLPAKPAPPFDRLQVLSEGKPTGYIVHVKDDTQRVGTGHIVDVDLGFEDGLQPGDYLTVFLPNLAYDKYSAVKYDYTWRNQRYETPEYRHDYHNEYPAKIIGQLVILTTEKNTATAKIIYAVREIEVGDEVEVH